MDFCGCRERADIFFCLVVTRRQWRGGWQWPVPSAVPNAVEIHKGTTSPSLLYINVITITQMQYLELLL